jgi:hypothetical protein
MKHQANDTKKSDRLAKALLGADPQGKGVPIPGGEERETVLDARGGKNLADCLDPAPRELA